MKNSSAIHAFVTGVIANGMTVAPGEDRLQYLRPTHMEPAMQRQHLYTGCKSAGCRTFKDCICRCKDCTRWCKYRGVTITDIDGTVFIRFASGKLIISMPRHEYEEVKAHWERLELKLVEAPSERVTPV